ncbi:NACHT domain- and WD repeat-containing protein 1-like [Babylonia areolata]|uniref:NACHT domain- and WD repeat-containing protein 1-like n=1 Tax=Babylonia areolata TaxID=304850 RepID=UPI003FD60F51
MTVNRKPYVAQKKGTVPSETARSTNGGTGGGIAKANPEKITSKSGFDREAEQKLNLMIEGDLEDLPHLPRSIVRIFLSSTFSDMRAERNMLARQVYPQLRQHCAQFDLDFQVVDLRWGLTAETQNDHSGTKVCLQEIKNCQDVSLGPNFVGIMGHRYGMHRPLVVEIPVAEFEILMAEAKSLNLPDIPVVEKWYKRDDNAVPPMYVLQPIRTYYRHYGDMTPGKEEQRQQDLKAWNDTDGRLRAVMQAAARSAYKAKKISEMSWRQHFMSVTDHEIINGIVQASSPDQHTMFFIRDLTGLTKDALSQKMAEKYIDILKKDGQPHEDKDTGAMITDLLGKVKGKLNGNNVVSLSTQWHEGGIDPEKFPEHEQYISQFCSTFLSRVSSLINQGLDQRQAKVRQREWYTRYNEVLHHLRFCNSKCESFCGQDEVLMKAKEYVLDFSTRKPFIIHAPSGAGKTSVMAMIMKSLKTWLPGGHVGMIRFLGTSPQSIDVRNVLFNVCGQLADSTNILMERLNYTSWKGLKAYAPRLLRRVSSKLKKPAIILLDSLDQLAPTNDAYSMDWLPTTLPQNIKLIVSTLPEEHGILKKLKQILPDPKCYCAVPLLPQATGQQIVQKYLQLRNRKITEEQLSVVLKAFAGSPSPLYLKLLMDEAVSYPSFLSPDPASIPGSISLAINALYDELEVKFGRQLVQSALGLLTVGLNGLSDVELEDALSCCDTALDEVYKFHDPPVPGIVRIPPVLWARIRYDLREYLVERLSQGKTTLYWYHRQFIETATERYASGMDGAALHAVLYQMFLAEDGVKKSITLSNRKNLFVKDADRQTTPQPTSVNNTRKLECVTYHLMHMKDLLSPDEAKASVFANLSFLSTKLMALGVDRVLGDLGDFLTMHPDEELLILRNFMESQRNSLLNLRSFAFSLIASLSVSSSFRHLNELKHQAELFLTSSDKPQLIPCLPCLAPRPGDPSLLLSGFARVVDQTGDCVLLEKVSVDEDVSSFAVINIGSSEVMDVLLESNISDIKLIADGQGYVWASAESLKCKMKASGKEVSKEVTGIFKESKVVPKTTAGMKISVGSDGTGISLFAGNQASVVDRDLSSPRVLSLGSAQSHVIQSIIPCCVDSSSIIGSGNVSDHQNFVAQWKSGADKPALVEFKGSLTHSLLSVTAEEQFVVCVMQPSNNDSCSLVVVQTQPFTEKPSVACGQVSQLRVSSIEQVVAILSDKTDVQFIDVAQSTKLDTVSHKKAVSDFDVVWEEDRVVVSDQDGDIAVYTRSGKVLVTFTGHSQGISYLRFIGEAITVLTCSGLVKVWDGAAISAMIASSASSSPSSPLGPSADRQNPPDADSLNSYTNVISIAFDETGQELITFAADGNVAVWATDSLKKLRSFSVGIAGHAVRPVAFSQCVVLDKDRKCLKVIRLDTSSTVCDDLIPQNVLCYTVTSNQQSLLVLSEQPHLVLQRVDLDGKSGHVSKTLTVQLGYGYVSIDMVLSASERYVTFQVTISEKDYEAVAAMWKKGKNLIPQRHRCRFSAVDLNGSSGVAQQCFRPLTKVPTLGVDIQPYTGNTMLLATRRWLIFWDIPTGKCDQRLSKSTRKTMFYRPDWVKAAAGANICGARSPKGDLQAAGSEDGYMFVYEFESGHPVGMKAPAAKHQAPVSHVRFTPDNSTVLSVCHNGVLKLWAASAGTQVASMKLGTRVRQLQLSRDGSIVVAVTEAERSRVAVFKLHKGKD